MAKEKEGNSNVNRIKAVLADKMKTNKWLAEELGVAPTTVSKWCTNGSQPPLETLVKIAKALDCEIGDLVRMD
ncbi:helix-turn-helix domain-containing protein [Bacteroides faecalis]|uniref:Transcriptional regulator n=1 Tax=Bacteroides faecalis TaxID=2447885 RepID=A0A401LUF5_9BACE|nr:helix-turn-helix transcriptional regulator [Bacteroides faecalis]GCB35210.1 transcriptional regulator [Bacteroides faecalis]